MKPTDAYTLACELFAKWLPFERKRRELFGKLAEVGTADEYERLQVRANFKQNEVAAEEQGLDLKGILRQVSPRLVHNDMSPEEMVKWMDKHWREWLIHEFPDDLGEFYGFRELLKADPNAWRPALERRHDLYDSVSALLRSRDSGQIRISRPSEVNTPVRDRSPIRSLGKKTPILTRRQVLIYDSI